MVAGYLEVLSERLTNATYRKETIRKEHKIRQFLNMVIMESAV